MSIFLFILCKSVKVKARMFINDSSKDKKLKNNILALGAEAARLKAQDNEVINSTSGMLKNEDGTLFEFASVKKASNNLSAKDKYAYVDSGGTPTYNKAAISWVFGEYLKDLEKDCFIDAVPTPGGSGALHLAFTNYLENGDTVLLPNHMWENYLNMAKEAYIKANTYRLFNDNDEFDIEDLNYKVNELKLNRQNKIMILINDPCENPTGFCMKDEDYDKLIAIANNNPNTKFVYLMDVAYFDFYSADPNIIRSRYAKFKGMPNNAMALFVFSGSKSFGLYGLRIGALIGVSKSKEEIETFKAANSYSCRATWSACSTLGMSIIEHLVLNEEYRENYEEEVRQASKMLEARSLAFLSSAKEVGLKVLPYERGFFICVACNNPEQLVNALHEDKIHAIATKSCLRIALCSVNKNEAQRMPRLIKNRLDSLIED